MKAEGVFESSLCFQALASREGGGNTGRNKRRNKVEEKEEEDLPVPAVPTSSSPLPPSNKASDLEFPDATFCFPLLLLLFGLVHPGPSLLHPSRPKANATSSMKSFLIALSISGLSVLFPPRDLETFLSAVLTTYLLGGPRGQTRSISVHTHSHPTGQDKDVHRLWWTVSSHPPTSL